MSDRFAAAALPVDEPGRLTLLHPGLMTPIRDADGHEAYIDLLPDDSTRMRAFERKLTSQGVHVRNGLMALSAEERAARFYDIQEDEGAKRLAAATVGWCLIFPTEGFDWGTAVEPAHFRVFDCEFTEAAALDLYSTRGAAWIRDQAFAFRSARVNFMKGSSRS